jgi:hypothetical protein
MSIFVAGLDLGQAQDFSALIVIEARGTFYKFSQASAYLDDMEGLPVTQLDVRHVERFPLGTKYQQIASEVRDRILKIPAPRYLCVDKTGVGAGVIETMARLKPISITITGGNKAQLVGPDDFSVPKRDLVAALQVGLQAGQLRIAKGLPHAELLTREMLNFRAKISAEGHDTYSAWREADHDDLVLATAMAAWTAKIIFELREQQAGDRMAELQAAEAWAAGMAAGGPA